MPLVSEFWFSRAALRHCSCGPVQGQATRAEKPARTADDPPRGMAPLPNLQANGAPL